MKLRFITLLSLLLSGCASVQHGARFQTTDFTFPWSTKPAPKTHFTAWSDTERLHFRFHVEDRDIVLQEKWTGESTLDVEDRVELFFAAKADSGLKNYWCLEIDPQGRVHDYHAQHYRKFDHAWNCPGLKTTARRLPNGYEVTASLPLKTLTDLLGEPIHRSSELRLGLFRAEFYGKDPKTHGEANDNWLSWIKPDAQTPDFHVPSAFRVVPMP